MQTAPMITPMTTTTAAAMMISIFLFCFSRRAGAGAAPGVALGAGRSYHRILFRESVPCRSYRRTVLPEQRVPERELPYRSRRRILRRRGDQRRNLCILPCFCLSFFVETFQNRTIKKAYLLPAYKGGTPMPGLNAKKRVCQHTDIPFKRKWSPMKFGVFLCTHCLKIQRSFICQFLLVCCFLTFQVTKNQNFYKHTA